MPTVLEVAAAVGPAQLEIVQGDGRVHVRDVSLVAVSEVQGGEHDTPVVEAGDLVLCVAGADDASALPGLFDHWARLGVAGVALGGDLTRDEAVVAAAADAGICLLAIAPGTAWAQLVWLLMALLGPAGGSSPETSSSGFGELFTLADALESVLGGPVTIEDPASRVLAHSARQEGADPARLSTIVGRRVPAELTERFRSMGVLRALQRSDDPVTVPSWAPGISPRLVIPVRAGRELLGSIWAVVDHPVPPDHVTELQRVVSLLALHLLRLRAQEDLVGRLEAERLQAALTGVPPTGWSMTGSRPWRVVCLAERTGVPTPGHADRWRAVLRWGGWRTPRVCEVDGALFALVDGAPSGQAGSWSWLASNTGTGLVAASSPVTDPDQLASARLEAFELMGLLQAGRVAGVTRTERQLAAADDAWAALTVSRAVAAVGAGPVTGPVRALLEHDASHGTNYATTLAADLAHPGDPRAAAAALHVHPNTFRYRMRRLAEVARLDLAEPQVRLAVQLQLAAAGR